MFRLALASLVLSTLAACGSSPAPAPTMTASAPTTSATPAAAPATAAATTTALPPPVEEAIRRVQGLTADAADAAIPATFSPTFLASVPADKVKALFTQLHSEIGACKEHRAVQVAGETKALVRLQCERGALDATIVVNPASPHLIDGLLLKPAS